MPKNNNPKTVEGKLESLVMDIIWKKQTCSPKEVLYELDNQYALTTISTVLERLYEKGLLIKNKTKGKVTFNPKVSQEFYSETLVNQFMKKIVNSFGDVAMNSFAKGVDQLPAEKRKKLIDLLKKYEK